MRGKPYNQVWEGSKTRMNSIGVKVGKGEERERLKERREELQSLGLAAVELNWGAAKMEIVCFVLCGKVARRRRLDSAVVR